jgi:hypothetical protein
MRGYEEADEKKNPAWKSLGSCRSAIELRPPAPPDLAETALSAKRLAPAHLPTLNPTRIFHVRPSLPVL